MTNARVNELDFLRFAGAMAVVFFHYAFRGHAGDAMSVMPYPWLATPSKYGYLAIELLFLISGFVISMTVLNRSLRHFVVSRFVRLYPTFWVCCTITFAVTLAIGAPRYSATLGQYLVSMTMLSEFFRVPPIDGVYWFLCVELLFYAAVAGAVFIGGARRYQWFLIAWLLLEVLLELLPIGRHPFRLLADYSVCFIAGAEFFLIWSRGLSFTRGAMVAASLSVAVLQAVNRLPGFEKHYITQMNRYVVAGTIISMFAAMLLISLKQTGALGRRQWLLAGAISYPLFLLHQNIGFMIFNKLYPAINPHVLLWGTIVLIMAVAYGIHVVVDRQLSAPMTATIKRFAA